MRRPLRGGISSWAGMSHLHVDLFIVGARSGATQPVEVEQLDDGSYRVLFSPGFVEGVAAGDVIRITDPKLGHFVVVERGGNLAVKFGATSPIAAVLPSISSALAPLGGRMDGAIDKAAVWTVPAAAGFAAIDRIMVAAVGRMPGGEWWYGNVYDEQGQPLRWWEPRTDTPDS
jgi:hypothetical protein